MSRGSARRQNVTIFVDGRGGPVEAVMASLAACSILEGFTAVLVLDALFTKDTIHSFNSMIDNGRRPQYCS